MTDRMELLENRVAALETSIKSSLEDFKASLLVEISKGLERNASGSGDGGGSPNGGSSGGGFSVLQRDTPDEYRMAVKKVELPLFDGNDPVGWITRAETYFEVQNTSDDVKVKLAKLSMEGPTIH